MYENVYIIVWETYSETGELFQRLKNQVCMAWNMQDINVYFMLLCKSPFYSAFGEKGCSIHQSIDYTIQITTLRIKNGQVPMQNYVIHIP